MIRNESHEFNFPRELTASQIAGVCPFCEHPSRTRFALDRVRESGKCLASFIGRLRRYGALPGIEAAEKGAHVTVVEQGKVSALVPPFTVVTGSVDLDVIVGTQRLLLATVPASVSEEHVRTVVSRLRITQTLYRLEAQPATAALVIELNPEALEALPHAFGGSHHDVVPSRPIPAYPMLLSELRKLARCAPQRRPLCGACQARAN